MEANVIDNMNKRKIVKFIEVYSIIMLVSSMHGFLFINELWYNIGNAFFIFLSLTLYIKAEELVDSFSKTKVNKLDIFDKDDIRL